MEPTLSHTPDQPTSAGSSAELHALAAEALNDPEAAELFEKVTGKSAQQVASATAASLTPAQQTVLSEVTVTRNGAATYHISSGLTRGRCATAFDLTSGGEGLRVIPELRSEYMQGIDDAVIRAAVHNFKAREAELAQEEAPALTLDEFRKTAKYVKDLSAHTNNPDDAGNRGFVYAGGCFIECTGFHGDPDAYTLTIGSDSRSAEYREDLDKFLFEQWYLAECVSPEAIEAALRKVFIDHPEYSSKDYGSGEFSDMVDKFAAEDFYALHSVAKAYRHHCNMAFENYPDWGTKSEIAIVEPGVAYSPSTPPPMARSDLGWPQSAPVLGFDADGKQVLVIFERKNDEAPNEVSIRTADSEGWDKTGKVQAWTALPELASLRLSAELQQKSPASDDTPSPGR